MAGSYFLTSFFFLFFYMKAKGLFGFSISITYNSVFITHNSKMVGPMVEKSIWIFITLFPVFVFITQFSNFWVMSYGNWKHILGMVIKYTWKDPLVRVNRNFWPFFFLSSPLYFSCSFFFSFFSSFSLLSIRSSFFFSFFFCYSSHNIFGLRLVLSFFFFFFSSSFTGLHWLVFFSPFLLSLGSGFWVFFFFSLGSVSLGTGSWRKKEKKSKKCTKLQVWDPQIVKIFD